MSGEEFLIRCEQELAVVQGVLISVLENPEDERLFEEEIVALLDLEPADQPNADRLDQLLDTAMWVRQTFAERNNSEPSAALRRIEAALSQLIGKFELLSGRPHSSALNSLDPEDTEHPSTESIRRYDDVARRATELTEDMRSLTPSERVKIAEILRNEVESTFRRFATPHASFLADLPYPILRSSEVLSEKARRKTPKRKWLDRDRSLKQTPVDFIRSVYGDRLGRGFTQADLKACDKSLYEAFHQWLRRADPKTGKRNAVPSDFDLPSLESWNERRVRQLQMFPETIDDAERERLLYVAAGRAFRGNPIK